MREGTKPMTDTNNKNLAHEAYLLGKELFYTSRHSIDDLKLKDEDKFITLFAAICAFIEGVHTTLPADYQELFADMIIQAISGVNQNTKN
jgi:hypothetical protein